MKTVHLGFKAFDCHELLCHSIARTAGIYTHQGLSVSLLDTTFVPDEALPENTFHTSCGAALTNFLEGRKRKVIFVACDRPMFWLYGSPDIATVSNLGQARVASYPDAAAPAQFLRKILSDKSASCGLLPCRDDVARLGLLTSGSVKAALLGSSYLPHEMEARGLNTLISIGESLRLPSTGLAVSNEMYEREPQLIATMVEIFQLAMKAIFDDDELLGHVLQETFSMKSECMDQSIETVRSCYNPFGFSYENLLQGAVDSIAGNLGLNSRPATELYEFKFIKSLH
ncbi:MAG: hypothetical protein IMF06_08495 [Proteobacteria bacterium]|nr:hypothetical protein [Pseudomonadota bacterium]